MYMPHINIHNSTRHSKPLWPCTHQMPSVRTSSLDPSLAPPPRVSRCLTNLTHMQIHDELVFDCPAQSECVTALRDIIKTAMETGISQHVQLQVGQRAVETHIDPGSTIAALVDCRELTAALACMLCMALYMAVAMCPSIRCS